MQIKTTLTKILIFGVIISGSISLPGQNDPDKTSLYLDGEFWRDQVLNDLIPNWYNYGWDEAQGAFYLNVSREWEPMPPYDKMPAMISRQIFSFSTAYLLSGEEKYLEVARQAANYLLTYGWDQKYGGWFGNLSPGGKPIETNKGAAPQLYTNVGLVQY
ncbi:MAG: AGE family epimerase/isomerase, partial [Bacteroidia bacterium]|nr:AGE family epimerase/isomerase [Bacteroidia bacterium]